VVDYLLDTNILTYWYDSSKPEYANVVARVASVREPDPKTQYVSRLYISIVTLGEIEYGHRVSHRPDPDEQAAYSKFVREQCPVALDINQHVVEHYGRLRAWLFDQFGPKTKKSKAKRAEELVNPTTSRELGIQENDIWIAAQAITYNLKLVTHDSGDHFRKALEQFGSDLEIEDWAS
jgi:predicted nucleic acid-binding protein